MTVRYVGPGGSDGNSGLTWALRKLTLNGVEDTPVVAGDIVYVGAGTYREQLTCDVDGSSGSPITYIGDVSGVNTDGVGGEVRVTGSDDDVSATRSYCFHLNGSDYRTFRGFTLELTTNAVIWLPSSPTVTDNTIIEDCVGRAATHFINMNDATNLTVRRCMILDMATQGIIGGAVISGANMLIENCIFMGITGDACAFQDYGDVTIKNCLFIGSADDGVDSLTTMSLSQTVSVYNCIFAGNAGGVEAATTGDLVEDYNTFFNNNIDRANVAVGTNSVAYPPLYGRNLSLLAGYKLSDLFTELPEHSPIARITGSSPASDDLFGITRPATGSKISYGPSQVTPLQRETTTTYSSSVASVKVADAGVVQFKVPVTAVSTTISVRAYRESNYAGTLPRMVIREPGQSDRTTTDTGSAATWNLLTDTFTPSGNVDFVIVELQSLNTATSGSYSVFFDDLAVS